MAKRTGGFIGQDGLNAPDPATGVTGTAGDGQVTVSWTAPSDVGGAAITGYSVQSNDGIGASSSYNIENASYDNISLDVSGEDSKPSGIAFSNDGTKLFIAGYTNDNVYQYSLSTAFDLNTASYDSSFDISGQETIPLDIVFNSDGTKLYVVGLSSDSVQQYSLSTAFDLSTASYDSISFSFTGQDANPYGIRFNNDGTKMYMVGTNTDFVFQYSLSAAYNVSTATYDSVALNVDGQDESPNGITFNSDGTKLFMIGIDNDAVFQYSLTTAFDLSTASYDNISFSVDTQDSFNQGLTFSADGTKLYVVGDASDAIFQYSSGVPTSSPVTVTGLTNGTSYTFNVWAINPFGWSSPSDASGGVTPNPQIGDAYEGGYLAGYISTSANGLATHYLVVAPVSSGQSTQKWKTSTTSTSGTSSVIDGPTNSSNMNNSDHPAAQFCEGLTIGGYSDWYSPARDELEICYFNLKPTTFSNNLYSGANSYAVPQRGSNYTAGNPAQTSVSDFQSGGSQAFSISTYVDYWTSTEIDSFAAYRIDFENGDSTDSGSGKDDTLNIRAVRRVAI